MRVWNPYSGKCLRILKEHTGYIGALAVLPNGCLAVGSCDNTIRAWPMPASQMATKGQREAQLMRALNDYVSSHPNIHPFAFALTMKCKLAADYVHKQLMIKMLLPDTVSGE